MHAEIQDEICAGDKVVARVTMHGRHLGEFLGRPPTGKEFAAEHIHIWRIQDGKVIEPGRSATTSAKHSSSG
jgi:predicted ester cyclase